MAGFLLNGVIKIDLLGTIPAAPLAPTQSELTGGDDVVGSETSEELIDITGWQKSTESVPTGGYSSLNVGSLAGKSSYPQSSLTWRTDDTDETIFGLVDETTTLQWLYISQNGRSSGNRSYGFPVTIAVREEGVVENVPQSFRADFSLTPPYKAVQAA